MIKVLKTLIFVFVFLCTTPLTFAQEAFTIEKFDLEAEIEESGKLIITEKLYVHFTEERRGIFRDIPEGDIQLKVLAITNEKEENRPYQLEDFDLGTRIRIGDPDVYLIGNQIYHIRYEVLNAIRFFEDHDEIYWNVTGNNWPTRIQSGRATFNIPSFLTGKDIEAYTCFTGGFGETKSNCSADRNSESVQFTISEPLFPFEGMSVAIKFPKGTFPKPARISFETIPSGAWINQEDKLFCISDCEAITPPGKYEFKISRIGHESENIILELKEGEKIHRLINLKPKIWFILAKWLLRMLALLIVFEPIRRYYKKGRDPKGQGSIPTQYEAPDLLSPAEAGTLYDESADLRDISASIIDLAVRGFITIKVLPKAKGWIFKKDDYELIKNEVPKSVKTDRQSLDEIDTLLLNKIFDQKNRLKVSEMTYKLGKSLPKIKGEIYQSLINKGYLPRNPETIRTYSVIRGAATFIAGFPITIAELILFGSVYMSSVIINGLLSLFLTKAMPRRTLKGVKALEHLKGFKDYLKIAEKDRLQFQEKEYLFYQLLPFAMTFGVVDKWSKAFKGILTSPPDWYVGSTAPYFDIGDFNQSISSFSTGINQAFASQPNSGGSSGFSGGFSGGGSGGGGGGSW